MIYKRKTSNLMLLVGFVSTIFTFIGFVGLSLSVAAGAFFIFIITGDPEPAISKPYQQFLDLYSQFTVILIIISLILIFLTKSKFKHWACYGLIAVGLSKIGWIIYATCFAPINNDFNGYYAMMLINALVLIFCCLVTIYRNIEYDDRFMKSLKQ